MRPQHQVICIVRGKIIGTGLGVGVVLVERILPREGLLEITTFAGRFVERQRGTDHGREIGSESREEQLSLAPGVAEAVAFCH